MRVFPQRWWYLAVGAVIGLMVGAAAAARISDSDVGNSLWGGGFGAIAGVLLGVATLTTALPHDTRLIALRRRFPDAGVVQALRDEENAAVLAEVLGAAPAGRFSVVFDGVGASIWDAGDAVDPRHVIPWAQIASVSVGAMVRPTRFGTRAYFRLVLTCTIDGGTTTLPFGVERVPAFPGGRTTLSDGELELLVERLTELRPTA